MIFDAEFNNNRIIAVKEKKKYLRQTIYKNKILEIYYRTRNAS